MHLPHQLTIYLDQHDFYIASWRWWSLQQLQHGKQEALLESLQTIIHQLHKNTCVDIILERIDETFQQELLPALSTKESKLLLRRKLLHHFSDNTFHAVIPLQRQSDQSSYILFGVDADEFLQSLITLLMQAKLCLRAMYLSAQVSTVAVMHTLKGQADKSQGLNKQSSLIIEILPHQMVRKSFVIEQSLALSHCTPLYLFDTQTDIQKTLSYCQNLNLPSAAAKTNLILLRYADDSCHQQYAQQCSMVIEASTISHLARSGHTERAHFLIEVLRRHKIQGNLLAEQHQKYYRAMLWRIKLCMSSLLLLILICTLSIRLELGRQALVEQTRQVDQQHNIWRDSLRLQQEELPVSSRSFSKIEDLVDLDTYLRTGQQSPAGLLQQVSLVLAQNPIVRVDRLRWIYSHHPIPSDEESPSINPAEHDLKNMHFGHAGFHTFYLNGVLDDASLSLATSAQTFNNFLLALKSQEELYRLEVLAYPTDFPLTQSQQMSVEQIKQGKPFALRVTYWGVEE